METRSILIDNVTLLGSKMKKGSIIIENDKIIGIGETKGQKDADEIINGEKKVLMPGIINTHTHLSMSLLRGLADDLPLDTWLNDHIWPVEANLTGDYCYAGALLSCIEMIKSGTTTFNDMYFFMDDVAKAVDEAGLRGMLCHGMIDLGDAEKRKAEFKETLRIIEKCHDTADGRIKIAFGPHAPYTCSEELLKEVRKKAGNMGLKIHIHITETEFEVQQVTEAHGSRPFEYLDEIGFLGEDVTAAHAVWVSDNEINIIKENKVNLSYNPASNMKLASGISPVSKFIQSNINVSLGTDGAASNNNLDMIEEMKLAALLQKVNNMDSTLLPAEKAFQMATINGAKALGLQDEIGTIEVGKKADLALLDMNTPSLTPYRNPVSHLVYAANGSNVDTVICNGEILMQNKQLKVLNEAKVIKLAEYAAEELLSKS